MLLPAYRVHSHELRTGAGHEGIIITTTTETHTGKTKEKKKDKRQKASRLEERLRQHIAATPPKPEISPKWWFSAHNTFTYPRPT
jgi:hypothetical protein